MFEWNCMAPRPEFIVGGAGVRNLGEWDWMAPPPEGGGGRGCRVDSRLEKSVSLTFPGLSCNIEPGCGVNAGAEILFMWRSQRALRLCGYLGAV